MDDLQKQLLEKHDIIIHSYQDNTIKNIPQFLRQIKKITDLKDKTIIQLLDSDYICGKSHINQAIAQSIKAFDEKENFANDKGLEICVRLSAQKQITEALNLLGVKNKGNITVVYIDSTEEQIEKVESLLNIKNDDLIEKYDENKIKTAYNIKSDRNIMDYLNEKIALLSIKT